MKHIAKGREPRELVAWRAQPGAARDGGGFTAVKDEIRKALVRDQAYLCAYCMRRIEAKPELGGSPPSLAMKVEHWRPQSRAPRARARPAWTQGRRRGRLAPQGRGTRRRVRGAGPGLNHRILVIERRVVIDRAIAWLHAHFADEGFRRGVVRAIAQAESPHDGRAPSFCGTLRLWARGRFRDEIAPVG